MNLHNATAVDLALPLEDLQDVAVVLSPGTGTHKVWELPLVVSTLYHVSATVLGKRENLDSVGVYKRVWTVYRKADGTVVLSDIYVPYPDSTGQPWSVDIKTTESTAYIEINDANQRVNWTSYVQTQSGK